MRDRGNPIEAAASRKPFGTNVNMSSVVRTITGITRTASTTAPAISGEVPHRPNHDLINEKPDHDGRRAQEDVIDEANNVWSSA